MYIVHAFPPSPERTDVLWACLRSVLGLHSHPNKPHEKLLFFPWNPLRPDVLVIARNSTDLVAIYRRSRPGGGE